MSALQDAITGVETAATTFLSSSAAIAAMVSLHAQLTTTLVVAFLHDQVERGDKEIEDAISVGSSMATAILAASITAVGAKVDVPRPKVVPVKMGIIPQAGKHPF